MTKCIHAINKKYQRSIAWLYQGYTANDQRSIAWLYQGYTANDKPNYSILVCARISPI